MSKRLGILGVVLVMLGSGQAQAGNGAALYAQNCALCHQMGASGMPGQFPRLAGRFGAIASHPEGRAYLIKVLSFGLEGPIKTDGQTIAGQMPPFGAMLSVQDTADLANYLQALATAKPVAAFTPAEVAKARAGAALAPAQVFALRKQLVTAGKIP